MAIQSDQEFAPTQIARAVFPTAFRGYDQDAVRRYLSRLAAALEHQQEYAGLGELEPRTPAHERVEELEAELEALQEEIKDLELELVQRSVDGSSSSGTDGSEDGEGDERGSATFDEHRAIELLGQETARVLESARSAAADILKRAETQAASLKAQAKSELAEARRRAEAIVSDTQADSEAQATRIGEEAKAHADRLTGEAEEHRAVVVEESAKILADAEEQAELAQAGSEERAKQIVADAETLRQQVISELVSERRQAQVEMDRMTAARDRLAMSLAVARSELDEVADALVEVSTISIGSGDNIASAAPGGGATDDEPETEPEAKAETQKSRTKRKRAEEKGAGKGAGNKASAKSKNAGSQAKRGGSSKRKGSPATDDGPSPSDLANPDDSADQEPVKTGSALFEDVSPPAPSTPKTDDSAPGEPAAERSSAESKLADDHGEEAGDVVSTNQSSSGAAAEETGSEEVPSSGPEDPAEGHLDAGEDEQAAEDGGGPDDAEVSQSTTPEFERSDSEQAADDDVEVVDISLFERTEPLSEMNEPPKAGEEMSLVEGFTTIELNDIDLTDSGRTADGDVDVEVDVDVDVDDEVEVDDDVDGDGSAPADPGRELVPAISGGDQHPPEEMITTVSSRKAADHRDRTRGDLLIEEPYTGRLAREFAARDVALARSGPNFRRQLRRALNDDQSDVLDRLRAGRGEIESEELPAFGDQIDRYLAPLRRGLAEIAQAGAKAGGQRDLSQTALDNLVRQLAKYIVDKVREPTIDVIQGTADNDRERILEPIRALYRDFRNVGLSDLTEDALYEAFAIGLYDSIEPSAPIRWVTDPRCDPDPVCEINSQRDDIAKGMVFPSGHARPLSLPGCRCLVMVPQY